MCHIWLLLASRSGCGCIAGGFDFGFGRGLFRLLRIADGHDPQDRELLAMAVAPAVIVTTALLEDDDLVGLRLSDDFRRNGQTVRRLPLAPFTCKPHLG